MDRRADIVNEAGQRHRVAAAAAADGVVRFDDVYRMSRFGEDNGGCKPVGTRADDHGIEGTTHAFIVWAVPRRI